MMRRRGKSRIKIREKSQICTKMPCICFSCFLIASVGIAFFQKLAAYIDCYVHAGAGCPLSINQHTEKGGRERGFVTN